MNGFLWWQQIGNRFMVSKQRTRHQFRLTWLRLGLAPKSKLFQSESAANDYRTFLTSPTPWKKWAPSKEADDFVCCSGAECGCYGKTVGEEAEETRAKMPPILWFKLTSRTVTATSWSQLSHETLIDEPVEPAP